ncbi:hypothetical protein ADLECEL_23910 [Adlercreutzia equolifaciens subsp. celatus]|nr:hypothetical protein ADLECEL_23910 [Adlercreutzia equolifaciens subsp. celatus]
MNRTSLRALTASMPSATARCVLPTPGLPTRSTFSAPSTKRRVASSSISALGTEGWKDQSKPASVFTQGKPDERTRWRVILASLAATSASVISARAAANSISPSPTILT